MPCVTLVSSKFPKENEHVINLVLMWGPCDITRQSCGVAHYTLRLLHETQNFVVVDKYTTALRLMGNRLR